MLLKRLALLLAAFLVCAFALFLVALAVVVLRGAPARPHAGFWTAEKLLYGVLPLLATPAALAVLFSRHWAPHFLRRRNAWLVACAITLPALAFDAIAFQKLR